MRAAQLHRSHHSLPFLMMACFVMLLAGATVLACDHEVPILPDSITHSVSLNFGGSTEAPRYLARGIDAKAAAEPQLTALLTMDGADITPSRTLVATARTTSDNWTDTLGPSFALVSNAAIRAWTLCF